MQSNVELLIVALWEEPDDRLTWCALLDATQEEWGCSRSRARAILRPFVPTRGAARSGPGSRATGGAP